MRSVNLLVSPLFFLAAILLFESLLCILMLLVQETLGSVRKTWSDLTSMNYWVVRDYYRLVDSVNDFEPQMQSLTDEEVH